MKPLVPLLAACSAPFLLSAAPASRPKETVRLEFKVLSVPTVKALELLSETILSEQSVNKIDSFQKARTAKLESYEIAYTPPNVQTSSETLVGQRYPEDLIGVGPGNGISPRAPAVNKLGVPLAFETRDTGYTFKAEPSIEPDGKIEVRFHCTVTKFESWNRERMDTTQGGLMVSRPVPQFATRGIDTQLVVTDHKWALLAANSDKDDPARIHLYLLRATIRSTPSKP